MVFLWFLYSQTPVLVSTINPCVVISKNPLKSCELGLIICQQTRTKTGSDRIFIVTSFMMSTNVISRFFYERLRCRKRHCNLSSIVVSGGCPFCPADRFCSPLTDGVKRNYNSTVTYYRLCERRQKIYIYFWKQRILFVKFCWSLGGNRRPRFVWRIKRCRSSISKYLFASKSGTLENSSWQNTASN